MTKRIIAILMSLLMVFSVAVLSACDKTGDGDGSGEESKVSVENLSAKELFQLSFTNTANGSQDQIPDILTKAGDLKVKADLKVNKLDVQGQDMTMGKPISLAFDASVDMDGKALEANASAELFGEKPTIGAIINSEGAYVTDLLGVNDKPIGVKFDELLGTIMPEAGANSASDMIAQATQLVDTIMAIVTNAVEKNITDEAFVKEMKDVTVEGVEFKGAAVVTFTIDKAMTQAIITEIITQISANEDLKALMGDEEIDLTEIEGMLEGFTNVIVTNTISADAETIAMDIIINGDLDGYNGFAMKSTFVGGNCKISVAPVDEKSEFIAEEGILNIAYTLDDAGNEKFVVSFTETDETVEFVKAEGTYNNNKHEGTLTVDVDGSGVSLKYVMEGDLMNGKLTISDLAIAEGGVSNTIPVTVTVEYSMNNTKADMKLSVVANIEGMANIDVSAEISVETSNVTVSAPADAVSINDIDENEAMDWLTKIGEKYPTIFSMISSMGGSSYDDNYMEDDYYYDDTYYEDGDY